MSHKTTVRLDDGREVLLSYGAPVAALIPGRGYVRTERRYSATTDRHVTGYAPDAVVVPHAEFMRLIRPVGAREGDD